MSRGEFLGRPAGLGERLTALPDVGDGDADEHIFRISSDNGPATTAVLEAATAALAWPFSRWRSKHHARRCLRALHGARAARRPAGSGAATARHQAVIRNVTCIQPWAIIERELRRFRRSPILIVVSMVFPLVQLVVLGYAFGGKVKT